MQIKDLAAKLNTTHTSISNWIKRFEDYFSENAKARNRTFTQEDLDTLATIATLSAKGLDYSAIERELATGERETFEDTTPGIDTRSIPVVAVEQMIDAAEIRMELEQTRSDLARAMDIIREERTANQRLQEKIDTMQEKIERLQHALGKAEGELEYRRNLDKRD